ncbi:MAG: TGS domain-containing protein [Candidatus Woesearchaeota archaeon]
MATNAGVEFVLAQQEYQKAKTPLEKIKALERMYATVPKHKGTENLRADIAKKMAYWKRVLEQEESKKSARTSFSIQKEAPCIGVVGLPNSGKSLLVKKLTNVNTTISEYEFSTKVPVVGMLKYKDVSLQMIDFIPIFEGIAFNTKLRQYLSPLRICDILLILIRKDEEFEIIRKELENFKIILGRRKLLKIRKSDHLEIIGFELIKDSSYDEILTIARDKKLHNHVIQIMEEMTIDEFLKLIDESYYFVDYIIVKNLIIDREPSKIADFSIDILKETNFDPMLEKIFEKMNLIRVYTKDKSKKISDKPIVVKKGSTIRDVAEIIHKDFVKNFDYAKIWGDKAKFPGQKVGLDYEVFDGCVVEFFLKF